MLVWKAALSTEREPLHGQFAHFFSKVTRTDHAKAFPEGARLLLVSKKGAKVK